MDEVLDKLGKCIYFSTIDLTKGFHQIEMDPADRIRTSFSTQSGHFEFLRMPFWLKNAPSTFQRLMNTVLDGLLGKICMVYLDDIIVFSTSLQEHIEALDKVFHRLHEANLKVHIDKTEFLKKETEFLGHIVTSEGIKPNPNKIDSILKYPLPRTTKEIKQFLGLVGFYRKFIRDFSKIAKPLTQCLKKGNKIVISKEYVNAVDTLKLLITKGPVLAYPDYEKKFTLTTDESNVALGTVLSQQGHPVCFAGRTLNEHELHYSTTEKELLGIVWATKYFRPYLYGRKFVINSDHRPPQWLHNLKEPNSKLQRWKWKLNEFDFDIKYIPGNENHVADALSRVELKECFFGDDSSNMATIHSAMEDSESHIPISLRPLNVFK